MNIMNTTNNFRSAAILIGTGIILGALGAHLLKKILLEQQLISFETGVRYQIYGGFSVLVFSILEVITKKSLKFIVLTNLIGVCIFSFSIYFLAMKDVLGLPVIISKILGPITPIGGLLQIVSWVIFILKADKIFFK
jgi:uncharacterized membrane protein YgdD (TMEM256/DUF423 family)